MSGCNYYDADDCSSCFILKVDGCTTPLAWAGNYDSVSKKLNWHDNGRHRPKNGPRTVCSLRGLELDKDDALMISIESNMIEILADEGADGK